MKQRFDCDKSKENKARILLAVQAGKVHNAILEWHPRHLLVTLSSSTHCKETKRTFEFGFVDVQIGIRNIELHSSTGIIV
jgi:hypothetical protein